MTLGEFIKKFREDHDLSQRRFASVCGLSNGYIAMLERGENPKTHKPIVPTFNQLFKIAAGMGIGVTELLASVDDMPVTLTGINVLSSAVPPLPASLIESFARLNAEGQEKVIEYAADLAASGRYGKKDNQPEMASEKII